MRALLFALLSALLLLFAAPAMSPAAAQVDEDDELTTTITNEVEADADATSAERLREIYAQLQGLEAVEVGVDAGVVTLSGEALNEEQADRAVRIARRIEGVVAVQDSIVRTLDVGDNIGEFNARAEKWWSEFTNALPLLGIGLGTWLVFILLGRFVGRRVGHREGRLAKLTPNPFLAEVAGTLLKFLFALVGLVIALNIVGASGLVTTVLGGAGVLGIAFGFAIRDTLENYISSILLSLRQPFRAGDHIVINGTQEGRVARLTSRATILVTLDGNHLRIPNADVFKGTILNYTTNPQRRFTFRLGVDSADDPVSAIDKGLARICEFPFILSDPNPKADIIEVGDSSILIEYRAWIDQTESALGKSRSAVIQAVKNTLEASGFSLPEPIYRLRIDGLDAGGLPKAVKAQVREVTPDVPNTTDVHPGDGIEDVVEAEGEKANLLSDSAEVE